MIDYDCMGFHADFMDYTFRVNWYIDVANQWENPRNMIEKVPNLPRQQIAEEEVPESDEEAPPMFCRKMSRWDSNKGLWWICFGDQKLVTVTGLMISSNFS